MPRPLPSAPRAFVRTGAEAARQPWQAGRGREVGGPGASSGPGPRGTGQRRHRAAAPRRSRAARRLRTARGAGRVPAGGGRGCGDSWRRPRRRGSRPPRAGTAARPEPPGAHRSPPGRPLLLRAQRHGGGGGSSAAPRRPRRDPPAPRPPPPGRRAGASSRRRPRPPSSRARPPALLGPGPLLPSRLLTALRRIPLGDCAAILRGESELQSQARPRPQPDWEARRPPRGSRSRPLPGRAAPRGAPPAHFRLGPGRIGRVGGRRAGLGGGWLRARAPHPHTVRRQAHACGQRAQTAASWTCRLKVGAKDDVCGEAR